MSSFDILRAELENIASWRARLAELGVLDTGPLFDAPLGFALATLERWTAYYQGLVADAERLLVASHTDRGGKDGVA